VTKSILITGAGGQVGHELANAISEHRLVALNRQHLDITDRRQIETAFDLNRPDLVINAAAYTQVDRAEAEAERAFAINRDAVAYLASACGEAQVPLFHISTDYVFDGGKTGAYRETDSIAPIGIYGESKAEGEGELQAAVKQHIILRTSWIFSASGGNFVNRMLRLGKEREELGIVDDQHGCPTSARSIAAALLTIADRHLRGEAMKWGIYHYCNAPATTWYQFALEIFGQAGGYDHLKLKPISSSEYPTAARRPFNSVLDCSLIEKDYGIRQVSWGDELQRII
jgi:dTDP-4-dehydrorhamnose reductase